MTELWIPQEKLHERRVQPTERKTEGGSQFDDELQTEYSYNEKFAEHMQSLIRHINERPDHAILVGSAQDRTKLRSVFNMWRTQHIIGSNPNIRIDYGIPDGTIRIGDGR